MAIYMYRTGSPFEDILNSYMTTGEGLNPYNMITPSELGNGTLMNGTWMNASRGNISLGSVAQVPPISGAQSS